MLLSLLELAGNHTLEYSHTAKERLAGLYGKTMMLTVLPLNQSLVVTPQRQGVEFSADEVDDFDVRLTATLGALLKIGRDGMDNADLKPGELSIEGDPIVGQRFAQLMGDLDIDWNSLLTEQVGDAPAQVIQLAANRTRQLFSQSQENLKILISRILKDDLAIAADAADVEAVMDNIDDLRADSDRLFARLKRLVTAIDTSQETSA